MKNLNFFILCFAILFQVGNLKAQITVSPWKMHKGKEGVEGFIKHTNEYNGHPSAYAKKDIPKDGDDGWVPAPTDAKGEVSINWTSTLKCKEELDFTYFKTSVSIPKNTVVDRFTVSYNDADDGARIYIFNSKYPNGAYDPKADLIFKKQTNPGAVDLSRFVQVGEVNKVVIVQFDDCATGNNVNGILINVNGKQVKTTDPNAIKDLCGQTYETVELNGRIWLKTNVKVPTKTDECCKELQHMSEVKRNGNGKSPFTYSNFDYDAYYANNKVGTEEMWHQRPYYSSFNNNPDDKHGGIFNYFAIEKCNVCPDGFRLPTEQEFMDMAKAEDLINRPNRAEEDWGAIGRIDGYGSVVRGRFGEYWTSTPDEDPYKARAFVFNKNGTFHVSSEDKRTGCYVRCIKTEDCMFYWSSAPEISTDNNKVATGEIKGVKYTYTSSHPIEFTNDIFNHKAFPESENIPNQRCIKNSKATKNEIVFEESVKDPVLVFSSIGQSGVKVPIKFNNDINVLWKNNKVTMVNKRQIEGEEGFAIVQIMGTHSSINFDYTAPENYVNFLFGVSVCNTVEDIPDFTKEDGHWTFGWGKSAGEAFNEFENKKAIETGSPVERRSYSNIWWSAAQNTSNDVWKLKGHNVTFPPKSMGAIALHPGPNSNEYAKIRYTAPVDGDYNIHVRFKHLDNDFSRAKAEIWTNSGGNWNSRDEILLTRDMYNKNNGSVEKEYKIQLKKGQIISIELEGDGSYNDDYTQVTLGVDRN